MSLVRNPYGPMTPARAAKIARALSPMSLASLGSPMAPPMVRGAQLAYNYGPSAYRAASKIASAFRGYRTRRRGRGGEVGMRAGVGTAKRNQVNSDGSVAFNQNQLYTVDIIPINRQDATSVAALNRRDRDMVHMVGVKICINFRCRSTAAQYCNFAVLAARHRGAIDGTDWFRDNGAQLRSVNFSDTNLNSLERHCNPINSDDFIVLAHKRWEMFDRPDWANAGKPGSYAQRRTIRIWVPINRQIRYEGDGDNSEQAIHMAWWFGGQGLNQVDSQNQTDVGDVEYHAISYFKEPMPVYKMAYNYGRR